MGRRARGCLGEFSATCVTSPGTCGPYSASGAAPWYFNVWNTSSITLVGMSYVIALSGGANPNVTLTACSVAWNTSNGNCTGTKTTVLNKVRPGTYPVTLSVPTAAGSAAHLQAQPGGAATSMTISTAVCSSATGCSDAATARQIRNATNTNS